MSSRKLKLLFLARPFPPLSAVGGVRTWNIAHHLGRLGWEVTVVTPSPSVWRRIENAEEVQDRILQSGIRTLHTDHSWRCLAPEALNCRNRGLSWIAGGFCRAVARWFGIDGGIGWIKHVRRVCSALGPSDVDLILATGSPYASFTVARSLARRLHRPYVLDYRDPWTGNPYQKCRPSQATIRKQARLLADSAGVTIVSPSWASAMASQYAIGSKLHVISNGYDDDELSAVLPKNFGHFAIVYTGQFYPPKRVISPVLAALQRIEQSDNGRADWRFHYYGGEGNHVQQEATRFGISGRVILHGTVPRSEALAAVAGAAVVVIISSISPTPAIEDSGMVPAKVYEAIGLGRPMLLVAPPGSDVAEITEKSGLAGRFIADDIDGIESFLIQAMRGVSRRADKSDTYSWTAISRELDAILRAAVDHQKNRPTHTKG